ncbi:MULTISPECIES: zinc-dependent metalloprotease [Gammaproteobacteria]|uniref:zinc-dependent metalloprotease n=1 Tax=Gammaproteobacteria TaxID=1236 RepID=UPI000DD0C8A8|nr:MULTISPECIES: zinc-dependent metalloprotease [Gammaproteobacteria]RTE86277.1 DUF5117 domain-containing protein [Aliidiomarina sp. B3213]TCZ91628.1 DUF5117 domain-containing protein [Lysobacter sp. N42]
MLKKLAVASAVAFALGLNGYVAPVSAQEGEDAEEEMTYAKLIEDLEVQEGLFNLYRDTESGELMMSLTEDQLNTPFLYFAMTHDGVLEAGHFRGSYRDEKIVEFRRYYNRIDIIQRPIRFKFDQDSALSNAESANMSTSVLASLEIKHEEDGRIVIPADDIFVSEALHRVSPYPNPNNRDGFSVGSFSKSQSRVLNERVYDNNLDVVVNYVFNNPNPSSWPTAAVADPRSTSVTMQHSFVALPENDFEARRDDARVGYFGNQFDDMTSADWAPYMDNINRWNLVKQDPSAEVSDPVEPIVFWLENTTPEEWRGVITEGVLAWNVAFEQAGISNALEVRIQPDDAEWDAGDINYNVIRWTSSPNPPFGGYGPSLANPYTGQILGADIMMEYVYMTNRWIEGELYGANDASIDDAAYCSQGHLINEGLLAGAAMSGLLGVESIEDNELLRQGMIHVILHEVGHTLGLNHNMKASILWDSEEVHDAATTQGQLTGSVMDYAPVNIAPPGVEQGDYYQYVVGPYDRWAIEYGYSQAAATPEAEEERLEEILSRSHQHELAFGNDADDMRAPGRHIDPRVMIGDMSSEPVKYAQGRFAIVNETFGTLLDEARPEGESHEQLSTLASRLFGNYYGQAGVVSRQIGGVYVERAFVGQGAENAPFTPVPKELQKEAMQTLTDSVFAPDVLESMEPVLAYMQRQRRGFNHYGNNEDPNFHDMVLMMQQNVLNHVLHPNTMKRITDSTRYGNEYPLGEVMTDLTDAVFPNPRSITTTSRNLQIAYVERLIAISGLEGDSPFDHISRTAAYAQLERIKAMRAPRRSDFEVVAHFDYIKRMIEQAMEA